MVRRLLLCIWFPWTPSVLTLADVKGRSDSGPFDEATVGYSAHVLGQKTKKVVKNIFEISLSSIRTK